MTRIAIIGMACRYPDATGPRELWENVLAGRRAFRRLPDARIRLADYWAADPAAPDRFYARNAALISNYEFDRVKFKIAGSTYRSADLTHWLALDMAAQALADAGFPEADGLPRKRTAVIVGNTLTGEFSRANVMRLRWPYVRRVVASALRQQGWDDDRLGEFLIDLEQEYKAPFPAVDEDTLAGSLSNTIAGRICNHFDLGGGGYTVDGACSSSLLSVATACSALVDGQVDAAVAGGVDLSIDPFELIGFAKTGALARREMRVYDRESNGFWPGEGCGMVVLMREPDALAAGHRIYATIAGWGISSDGRGGITRPEVEGYQLALSRAYERAGFGPETVTLFEGHGTGTEVGDANELRALSTARRTADPTAPPAAIGTIKAMIGHTKAAAGVAGLIKAVLAVHHQVIPPTVGCVDPHPELTEDQAALRVVRQAEPWPEGVPVRAGVTAMGFGGINTHLVLDGPGRRGASLDSRARLLASSAQDVELLLLSAATAAELRAELVRLLRLVPGLSYAELGDLAAVLHRRLREQRYRAAVVVSSPEDGERQLTRVLEALDAGRTELLDQTAGVFLGHAARPARLGYLFPGQGSGRSTSGGALRRRFAEAGQVYAEAELSGDLDVVATAVAQPRIVTASVAGLRVLTALGLEATVAVGHSLGEITALHWAGAMDDRLLLRLAAVRGAMMSKQSQPGSMAGIAAGPEATKRLLANEPVVIAGYNGPQQTVVAGPDDAVSRVCQAATDAGLHWNRLAVSHAFHSPLMAPAAEAFASWLARQEFGPLSRRLVSTVTAEPLESSADIPALLRRQITDPVRFASAVDVAAGQADLFVEVGPGRVLTRMVRDISRVPAVALDTDDESLTSLFTVLAAAFVLGGPAPDLILSTGRFTRPFDLDEEASFFTSPCEAGPPVEIPASATIVEADPVGDPVADAGRSQPAEDALVLLRRLVAERAELPPEVLRDDSRLLDELHLSSITVGQIVNHAARELGLPAVAAPANFATATVRELADALSELARGAGGGQADTDVAINGVASWVRPFVIDLVSAPPTVRPAGGSNGRWQVYAPPGHPLAEPLRRMLEHAGVRGGVLICLPEQCSSEQLAQALAGVQAAARQPAGNRLVLVQPPGPGAAALVKSARLEFPALPTTVVHTPLVPAAVDRVVDDVAATAGFLEVSYDGDGERRVPVLRPLPARAADLSPVPLKAGDVLLVTGGGKGITAESALALAAESGASLAILGRSDPEADPELATNLARMEQVAPKVRYLRTDITDRVAVYDAVRQIREELGPVTAVLHGAGRNEPFGLMELDPAELGRTFAPKVDGLRAVLAAVDADNLQLLVTFGSIIGRAGLRGEAHYALANEWLAELTRDVLRTHPHCRAVCLEWSVWSGVGMGERLSVVESLLRTGVTPITVDEGITALRRVLADPSLPQVVMVTGRTGDLETLRYHRPELPLLRFLERPLVHYHGVELVTEVDISPATDPYLNDHRLDGDRLFPAVLGLEAMAQVATALAGYSGIPTFGQVEFSRPLVVPQDGTTLRIAALVVDEHRIDVVIRSRETGFAADHFRASLHLQPDETVVTDLEPGSAELPPVLLDPAVELYGETLFQGQRFRRLVRYRHVGARRAEAVVTTSEHGHWFSSFLPGQLLLGDPGARDAFLHGIQVCVPDAILVPVGVDRIWPAGPKLSVDEEVTFTARERERSGDDYVYDVTVRRNSGSVVERWSGLRLRAVRRRDVRRPWPPVLLGPYIQRHLDDALGWDLTVAMQPRCSDRPRGDTAALLAQALVRPVTVRYRPDGRPEIDGFSVSAAHAETASMVVVGTGVVGCDLEVVRHRPPAVWRDLLGAHAPLAELIAAETGEVPDLAATRVWCAIECLQKAGRPHDPLSLVPGAASGWVVLASNTLQIATFVAASPAAEEVTVVAVLAEGGD